MIKSLRPALLLLLVSVGLRAADVSAPRIDLPAPLAPLSIWQPLAAPSLPSALPRAIPELSVPAALPATSRVTAAAEQASGAAASAAAPIAGLIARVQAAAALSPQTGAETAQAAARAQFDAAPASLSAADAGVPAGFVISGGQLTPGESLGVSLLYPRQGPSASQAEVASLVDALDRGDWNDPVFSDARRSADVARDAYEQGRLDLARFVTVVMRWETIEDFPLSKGDLDAKPVLASDGKLTTNARHIFGGATAWTDNNMPGHQIGLAPEQLARFEELVAALPRSERSVWIIHVPNEALAGSKKVPAAHAFDAVDRAIWAQGFKVPDVEKLPGHRAMVIPTFGLMQAYLDARFGADAAQMLPSFGKTSMKQLMQGIASGGRVLGLQYPGLVLDTRGAHGFELGRIGYTQHDFYHAYVASMHPKPYRRLFKRIYEVGREHNKAAKSGEPPSVSGLQVTLSRPVGEWKMVVNWYLGDLLGPSVRTDARPTATRLIADFGEPVTKQGKATLTGLVVRDLALHPEHWPGVNALALVADLGPEAAAIYDEALGGPRTLAAPAAKAPQATRREKPRYWPSLAGLLLAGMTIPLLHLSWLALLGIAVTLAAGAAAVWLLVGFMFGAPGTRARAG